MISVYPIQYRSPVRRGETINLGVVVVVGDASPVQRWLSDDEIAGRVTMLTCDDEHGEVALMQVEACRARIAELGVDVAMARQANAVWICAPRRRRQVGSVAEEINRACVEYLGRVP